VDGVNSGDSSQTGNGGDMPTVTPSPESEADEANAEESNSESTVPEEAFDSFQAEVPSAAEEVALRLTRVTQSAVNTLTVVDFIEGRKVVLDLLDNTAVEDSVYELATLGTLFISNDIGLSFSPQFYDALINLGDDLAESDAEAQRELSFNVTAISFVSATFTIGFITWLLQSGTLLASAVTTAPLWQSFDPVPVLSADSEESDE